jgi:hypothetical protein
MAFQIVLELFLSRGVEGRENHKSVSFFKNRNETVHVMNRGASKKNYQSITYNKWYYNLVNL